MLIFRENKYAGLFHLFFLFTFSFLLNPPPSFSENKPLSISGYYKNLFTTSTSAFTNEGFFGDTQRLRLEFQKQVDPWQFYLTLDNEALINDFSNVPDFESIRNTTQDKINSIDLDVVSVDNDNLYMRHSIYRAYIKYYSAKFQVIIGKQAVDWGITRFYSPTDLFNSVSPLSLERDEKIGIDAVNMNFAISEFSGLNLIAAPGNEEKSAFGFKTYSKIGTYDFSFISAYFKKDMIIGASFDGYIKNAGFRGEFTFTKLDNKRTFGRLSIGADYNPTDKLYILFEQFYNGGADDNDPASFSSSYNYSQKILSLKKHISNFYLNYQITPLLTYNHYTVYDWEGKSIALNPEIKYNIKQDVDISAGTQLFWGNNESEFGSFQNLYYMEVKLYF